MDLTLSPSVIMIVNIVGFILKNFTGLRNRLIPWFTYAAAIIANLVEVAGPVTLGADPEIQASARMATLVAFSWAWAVPLLSAAAETGFGMFAAWFTKITGARSMLNPIVKKLTGNKYGSERKA